MDNAYYLDVALRLANSNPDGATPGFGPHSVTD